MKAADLVGLSLVLRHNDRISGLVVSGQNIADWPEPNVIDFFIELQSLREHLGDVTAAVKQDIERRMIADKRVVMYHPVLDIKRDSKPGDWIVRPENEEKLFNELTDLAALGLADPALVMQAVKVETKTTYGHHMTYVKMLKEMGGKVAEVIEKYVRKGDDGPLTLSIDIKKPKKKGR